MKEAPASSLKIDCGFGSIKADCVALFVLVKLSTLIYLIVIITIVGFTDFYWLLRVTTAHFADKFAYVSPVKAVILGALLLHEPVMTITVIAISIILVGVALMVTTTGKGKKEEKTGVKQEKREKQDKEIQK